MNTLHLIADWFDELNLDPQQANCVWLWLALYPEVTFERKNLSLSEYKRVLTQGGSKFRQAQHNPENLVGYYPTEAGSLQIRINNCLVRDNASKYREIFVDPDRVWICEQTDTPTPDQNTLRED